MKHITQANPSARISIHHSWSELQNQSITVQLNLSTSGGSPGSTAPVDIAFQFLSSISSSNNFHPSIFYKHEVGSGNMWQLVLCWGAWKTKKDSNPVPRYLRALRLVGFEDKRKLTVSAMWKAKKTTAFWTHFKVQNAECAQSRKHFLCGMRLMHTLPLKHLDLHLIASRCLAHGPTKEFKQQRSDWIKSYSLKASDCRYTYLRYGRTWSWSWSTQTCPRARCAVSLCPV